MRMGMRRGVAQTIALPFVRGSGGKTHGFRRVCAGLEPSCFSETIDPVAPASGPGENIL